MISQKQSGCQVPRPEQTTCRILPSGPKGDVGDQRQPAQATLQALISRRLDSYPARFYLETMSLRSRIKVPAKKPRSWAVTLIKNRGVYLGIVEAPDEKTAELAASKTFTLSEWQRKRLLIRERV
jgi:hypothetical protein